MASRRSAIIFSMLLLSILALQSAWILAVDPFRAIDEFDHAQRAGAVAAGQWVAPESGLIEVSPELNKAVVPVCLSRPRRDSEMCQARTSTSGQLVVTSTAEAYNPAFYWLIGTISRPFAADGYHQLYAMRFGTALINGVGLATGLFILLTAFRSRWPFIMGVATLTPMGLYSSMVVAPNGLESAASFTIWSVLLALRFGRPEFRTSTGPWIVIAVASLIVGNLRTLGPFWLACILGCMILAAGRDLTWLRGRRARLAFAVGATGCITGAIWTLAAGTNRVTEMLPTSDSQAENTLSSLSDTQPLSELPLQVIVWILQTVGAIPYRDEPLPAPVFATVLTLWVVLVAIAMRRSDPVLKRASLTVGLISIAVPIAISVATKEAGWLWQGRYGWPLLMGVLLLAGVAGEISRERVTPAISKGLLTVTVGLMAASSVVAIQDVVARESSVSPLADSDAPWTLPLLPLAALVVVGFAGLLFTAAARSRHKAPEAPRAPANA